MSYMISYEMLLSYTFVEVCVSVKLVNAVGAPTSLASNLKTVSIH